VNSQQVGPDQLLGHKHSHLGRQNLNYSNVLILYGQPNCVLFSFVSRNF